MAKVDFNNFTGPQLSIKLLCLIKIFDNQNILTQGENVARYYIEDFLNTNFIYEAKNKERLVNNLLLFCLGKKSVFDKYIN